MSSRRRAGRAWDRSLARRALAVGSVTGLVTLVVVAATDGGGTWPARIGMTSALLPVAGSLATFLVVRSAEARGELLALACIGVSPSRATRGAAIGGAIVGAVGAALAASPLADLAVLFPREATATWIVDRDGARELTHGLRVIVDGTLLVDGDLVRPAHVARSSSPGVAAIAAVALAVMAVAAPLWVAAPSMSRARRGVVGGALLVLAIVSFQAVAADRAPSFALVVAPLALFADALLASVSSRRAAFGVSSRAPR